jgi:hypothetical protein
MPAFGRHRDEPCTYFGCYMHNRLDDSAVPDLDLYPAMLLTSVNHNRLLGAHVERLDANRRRDEAHNCFDVSDGLGACLGADRDKKSFELAGAGLHIDEAVQVIPQEQRRHAAVVCNTGCDRARNETPQRGAMMRRENHQIAAVRGDELIYALAGIARIHRDLHDLHASTSFNSLWRLLGIHLPPQSEQFAHMRLRIEIAILPVFGVMLGLESRLRGEREGHGVCESLHACV